MKRARLTLAVCTLLAACTRQPEHAAAPAASDAAEPPPTAAQIASMHLRELEVSPTPIRRREAATVVVAVTAAPPGTTLTLAWFGPDGWLVHDAKAQLQGATVTFGIPPDTFPAPGRYLASVYADAISIGQERVQVVD